MTQLTALKFTLRKTFSNLVHTANPINSDVFTHTYSKDKWSIAQIIGHLILSTKPITTALGTPKPMLKTAFGTLERKEWTEEQLKEKYTNALIQGASAPTKFVYKDKPTDKEILLSEFTKELSLLIEQIDNWNQTDLSKYVLPHPILGNISIHEMLYFTNYHTIHHHQQIIEIVNQHSRK